jgi:O-antigen/teichoic acid export membrane protein
MHHAPGAITAEKNIVETLLGLGVGTLLVVLVVWLLPIILILTSNKTSGAEKLFWLLAVVFVSWFAWILYMLLAPLGKHN